MERKALMAGSFDPVTVGHVDLVQRALVLFDRVVVAVGVNPAKRTWFTLEERTAMLREALPDPRVELVDFADLTVDVARRVGATVLLRGVRGAADVELELRNAMGNRDLAGIDTVWLPCDAKLAFISSSLVREIARCGGDVARYVPQGVGVAVQQRARRLAAG